MEPHQIPSYSTDGLQEKTSPTDYGTYILVFIMGLISLLTVIGNIVVILSYYLEKSIRQPANYFIFSLAVSDLVGFMKFAQHVFTSSHIVAETEFVIFDHSETRA